MITKISLLITDDEHGEYVVNLTLKEAFAVYKKLGLKKKKFEGQKSSSKEVMALINKQQRDIDNMKRIVTVEFNPDMHVNNRLIQESVYWKDADETDSAERK